jgi:hypothetical protein
MFSSEFNDEVQHQTNRSGAGAVASATSDRRQLARDEISMEPSHSRGRGSMTEIRARLCYTRPRKTVACMPRALDNRIHVTEQL